MAASTDEKLLRQMKFPSEFNKKVDMHKVNSDIMKKWITEKISKILKHDDDIVVELCFSHIDGQRFPDIKGLQVQLTGFLEKDAAVFCKELWSLLLSAQDNAQGVPKELLEAKKMELIQEKRAAERAAEESRNQRFSDADRSREIDDLRRRDREDRGFRGRGRRGWSDRSYDQRTIRDSRSPPYKRRSPEYQRPAARRDIDSYIPATSRRNHDKRRRASSHSPDSRARSNHRSLSPRARRRRSHSTSSPGGRSRSPSSSRSPPRRRRRYSNTQSPPSRRRKNGRGVERSRSHDRGGRDRSPRGKRRDRSPMSTESSRSCSPRRHTKREFESKSLGARSCSLHRRKRDARHHHRRSRSASSSHPHSRSPHPKGSKHSAHSRGSSTSEKERIDDDVPKADSNRALRQNRSTSKTSTAPHHSEVFDQDAS